MTTKQITATKADERIRQLYQTAYPEEEQIPCSELLRLIDQMHLAFTAYHEDGEFIEFFIVYPRPSFNWFWYFAVRKELRVKGYGQQILTNVIERYSGCSNLLYMESPDHPRPF